LTAVNACSQTPRYCIPGMIEDDAVQLKATDTVTVLEGFDAVRIFLEAVWQRQGKNVAEIAFVLGATQWEDGTPVDPAIWEDWLMAVHICRSRVVDGS
jgi:hypothetical protein